MKRILFFLLFIVSCGVLAGQTLDGKKILGDIIISTLRANGVMLQSVTNTTATSGNVNFFDGEYHINPANPSTAVYAGILSNCFIDATGASINSGGHVPCLFGYTHVSRSTPLAIGAEGKITVSGSGTVVDSAAPVHCGFDDIGTGATVTSAVLCNAQVTAIHGTLTNLTGYQMQVATVPTAPIANMWQLRAPDYSTSYATNYLGYECDISNAANHLCAYSPGTGQWRINGRMTLGTLTDDGVNQLQVTGNTKITGTLATTGQGAMPLYNASGTAINAPHEVIDTCTLSSNQCTVTFTGAAAFSSSSSYTCTANATNATNGIRVVYTSGTSVTFASVGATDNVRFDCKGT